MTPAVALRPLPPLTAFARTALMLMKHGKQLRNAIGEAEAVYRDQPQVAKALRLMQPDMIDAEQKAAVDALGISSNPLAQSGVLLDALPVLHRASVFGALRERAIPAPFATQAATATTAVGSTWVAEGSAKPAAAFSLGTASLPPRKNSAYVVMSDDVLRYSTANAEGLLRRALFDAVVQAWDSALLDAAAGDDSRPASITNGIVAASSTGSTAAAFAADLEVLINAISTGGAGLVFVMRPGLLARLALLNLTDPNATKVAGIPVAKSASAPAGTIILVDAAEMLIAGGDDIELDTTQTAALQIRDDPSDTAAELTSLWQHNLTALRAEVFANWAMARTGSVAVLEDIG